MCVVQHAITVEGENGATLAQLHAAVEKAKPVLWKMHTGEGDAPPFRLVSLREHEAIDLSDSAVFDQAQTLLKEVRLSSGDAVVVEWGDRDKSLVVTTYNTQQNSVTINFNHPDDIDPETRKASSLKVYPATASCMCTTTNIFTTTTEGQRGCHGRHSRFKRLARSLLREL